MTRARPQAGFFFMRQGSFGSGAFLKRPGVFQNVGIALQSLQLTANRGHMFRQSQQEIVSFHMKKADWPRVNLQLPPELTTFLDEKAAENFTNRNAEAIRAIKFARDAEQAKGA